MSKALEALDAMNALEARVVNAGKEFPNRSDLHSEHAQRARTVHSTSLRRLKNAAIKPAHACESMGFGRFSWAENRIMQDPLGKSEEPQREAREAREGRSVAWIWEAEYTEKRAKRKRRESKQYGLLKYKANSEVDRQTEIREEASFAFPKRRKKVETRRSLAASH